MSNILPRSIAPALNSALLAPPTLSVLRIVAGLVFLEHETGKLLGFPAGLPFIDKMPTGLLYFTGTMELVGGALIVLGLFTRPVAFILSGFMTAAYFMGHFPRASFRRLTSASRRCSIASSSFISPRPARGRGRSTGADRKRRLLRGITVRPVADRSRGLSGVLLRCGTRPPHERRAVFNPGQCPRFCEIVMSEALEMSRSREQSSTKVEVRHDKPRIVIVGGGFGGIAAAKALRHCDAEVVVIDRRNHHIFQPLLYQVATAVLAPSEVAAPIRQLEAKQKNVSVLLAEVVGVDLGS
jgi:uncharacterized membrane protein YphA (DoxX/SURF4 family)